MTAVDVVVLTWNDPASMLGAAVRSAADSEGVVVQVVVVDNGSQPPARVEGSDRVRLVRSEVNLGVAAGRNLGASFGSSELVCFLDSDATLSSESLAMLVAPFDDPDIGVAVPVFVDQEPEESGGRAPTLRVKIERGLGRRGTYEGVEREPGQGWWDVDFGIGACQLFRRSLFEAVGGLDDSIFYGPEDVDFCLRVKAAGYRVVQVAGTGVHHPPRRAFRKPLSRRGLRHGLMIIRHLWRHRAAGR